MDVKILRDRSEMGRVAATLAASQIRAAIEEFGNARIIVATGSSQFEVLDALCEQTDIDWTKVDAFHLDEYLGLDASHPASFCRYLHGRFVSRLALRSMTYLNGISDPVSVCREAGAALTEEPIDVALIGIGENGHIAFNDPPANFETDEPYIIVELDEACRRQQTGEGWFASLDEVPKQAISMSVRQILKTELIICSVPDLRKAEAVKNTVQGIITPDVPASILQTHSNTILCLDEASASLLDC